MQIAKLSDTEVTVTESIPAKKEVKEHTLNSLRELLGRHVAARDSWIKERDRAIGNLAVQEAKVQEIESWISQAMGLGVVEEEKESVIIKDD